MTQKIFRGFSPFSHIKSNQITSGERFHLMMNYTPKRAAFALAFMRTFSSSSHRATPLQAHHLVVVNPKKFIKIIDMNIS